MKSDRNELDPRREARLTDYLCGELSADDARALEQELARDPGLLARCEELRRTLELLRADAPALGEGLTPQRRAVLRAASAQLAATRRDGHAGAAPDAAPTRVFRIPVWARAAAGVLVIGGLLLIGESRPGPTEEGRVAVLGSVADTAAAPASAAARPSGAEPQGSPAAAARALEIEGAFSQLGYVGGGERSAANVPPLASEQIPLDSSVGFSFESTHQEPGDAVRFLEPHATPQEDAAFGMPLATLDLVRERGRLQDQKLGALAAGGQQPPAVRQDWDDEAKIARKAGAGMERHEELEDLDDAPAVCEIVDGYGRHYADRDVVVHLRRLREETPRDMFFRYYGDNPAVRTADDALSTFAADVDTASYALARNYLTQGHIPPKAAIRTEEFVNSFRQELAPSAEEDFALSLEVAPTPFAPEGYVLLRCGIKAREISRAARKPLNLVFVVDKSGSMAQESRLELVKRALELLVDQIRDDDTVGIVAFDSVGHEIIAPTPGAERWKIREALRKLETGGSTNAGEGLDLGYAMAERAFRKDAVNRVVLASDGVANTGETDQRRILEHVQRRAEQAIDLTTIGVGMGNHNDAFLERLADEGEGSCHYVDSFDEAKRVLVDGFTGAMQTVAREVKIQLEFQGGTVTEWRQLGYENRSLADQDFRNDAVDAGEVGAGHEVVALYEVRLGAAVDGNGRLATLRVRWQPDGGRSFVERAATITIGDLRAKWELAAPRFRLNATVAQFAEFLRRSVHARGDDYRRLQDEARSLARELGDDAQVRELRDLVDRAESLVRRLWPDDELALLVDEARRAHLLEAELECVRDRTENVEELLKEVRLQNEALESRLLELLQPR
jgi:Ca-activated chloride channel family protein